MAVYDHPQFDQHELVTFFHDPATGLHAIVAVHSSAPLGMAGGGCRLKPYASEHDALRDVLRLSRAMSFKLALARIPAGGAKSVILADPRDKSRHLLAAFGRAIDTLGGRYVAATDVGTTLDDLRTMREHTQYVVADEKDTAWATARGVMVGIELGCARRLDKDLSRVHVAVQGIGKVGWSLAEQLVERGARITVADVDETAVARAVERLGAQRADPESIHAVDADVFAPCALGDVLDARTIEVLRCEVVAGSANNPLVDELADAERLMKRNILYLPDFVLNMGGALAAGQGEGYDPKERVETVLDDVMQRVDEIGETPQNAAIALARQSLAERRLSMA